MCHAKKCTNYCGMVLLSDGIKTFFSETEKLAKTQVSRRETRQKKIGFRRDNTRLRHSKNVRDLRRKPSYNLSIKSWRIKPSVDTPWIGCHDTVTPPGSLPVQWAETDKTRHGGLETRAKTSHAPSRLRQDTDMKMSRDSITGSASFIQLSACEQVYDSLCVQLLSSNLCNSSLISHLLTVILLPCSFTHIFPSIHHTAIRHAVTHNPSLYVYSTILCLIFFYLLMK